MCFKFTFYNHVKTYKLSLKIVTSYEKVTAVKMPFCQNFRQRIKETLPILRKTTTQLLGPR